MTELPSSVTEQYFKQIVYDETTGRLYLIDATNKSFECDIYGNPTTKFDSEITGKAKYSERLSKSLIKPLMLKQDMRLYHPQNKYFEGYSQFPRPLSQPFLNEFHNRSLLLKTLVKNKRFTLPETSKLLQLKTNQGLSFMSSSIPAQKRSNREKIIKSIDRTCREYDAQEEMNQKHRYSQTNINSLKKLKQVLLLNSKDMVHGRKLPRPTELAKRQYQTIVELYNNMPNEKIQRKKRPLKNSESMPSLFRGESLFEKSKKNKEDDINKSIDVLFTIYKDAGHKEPCLIKGERSFRMKCKEETRLLSGYKRPVVKEKGILQKAFPNLPTRGDHYQRELKLIALVNPQILQEELRRNASDKHIFEKKKMNKMSSSKLD